MTTAAESLSVGRSTVNGWLKRGKAGEEPYCTFSAEAKKARAEGRRKQLAIIVGAARGGLTKTKTTIKSVRMAKEGEAGELIEVERTTVQETTLPDWTAAAWILERVSPEDFGKKILPYIPEGEDGEAGMTDPESAFLSLLEKLRSMPPDFQQRALEAMMPGGDEPEEDAP